jgi:1-acyl-sn-glycerol-3-phosphate acyltransferase
MIGTLRLLLRSAFTLACILLIILLMSITWCLGARRATRVIMQNAFRFGAPVWGIRIRTSGTLASSRPLIIVSNHFSYLDLFVLGSKIPAAFTPKSEVRSWPVIGFMCKVAGCLFIDRRPTKTLENKHLLERALATGDIISLFPEGTTNEGKGLLPFKSSFFSLAEQTGIEVQPLSVYYTQIDGRPITEADLPVVGWYGDSYFFPHMAQYLRHKGVDAVLVYHTPVRASDFASRKELARHCQSVIEQGMPKVVDKKSASEINPEAQNQTMEGNSVMPQSKH